MYFRNLVCLLVVALRCVQMHVQLPFILFPNCCVHDVLVFARLHIRLRGPAQLLPSLGKRIKTFSKGAGRAAVSSETAAESPFSPHQGWRLLPTAPFSCSFPLHRRGHSRGCRATSAALPGAAPALPPPTLPLGPLLAALPSPPPAVRALPSLPQAAPEARRCHLGCGARPCPALPCPAVGPAWGSPRTPHAAAPDPGHRPGPCTLNAHLDANVGIYGT